MTDDTDPIGWTDNLRTDGAELVRHEDGHFLVITSTESRAWSLDACPCCHEQFTTPRAAKLCANAVHPL